ncbi:SMP-30/gluconolactonase/LRE family protein [Nocardia sp. NPDC057272]|uniref:SMP-30/gluconolactonase/LRE family protein n=1 Tax=Nocardia sp. NPDC057272 TaxID=3346079 RepID=UPI00363AF0B9
MKYHDMTEFSSGHQFLEAPRWHDGKLWLSDFFAQRVITVDGDGTVDEIVAIDDSPSGLGFLPDGSVLVVTMHGKKVLRITPDRAVSEYADISAFTGGAANDMLVTDSGNAYIGNFGFDVLGGEEPAPTRLVRIAPDGAVDAVPGDVLCPNGLGLTPDGSTLVVAETFARRITAYDVHDDGTLSGARIWAELPEGFSPDGLAVDADGGVWVANVFVGAPESGFYRVEEGGTITDAILVPDAWAVACAFGGPDLDVLYLVCNATSLAEFAEGRSRGFVRTARVGRHGASSVQTRTNSLASEGKQEHV